MTYRQWSLVGAMAIYGLFGVPAPQVIGWPEIGIAAGLLAAIGPGRPLWVLTGFVLRTSTAPAYLIAGTIAFSLLLWLPLLRGLVMEWPARAVVRDIVPLCFLFLPIFLGSRPAVLPTHLVLAWALAGVGVAFVGRWWMANGWSFSGIGLYAYSDGRDYLLNAPAVVFAANWLVLHAIVWIGIKSRCRWGRVMLSATGGGLCLAALAATVHRWTLVLSGLVLIGYLVFGLSGRRRTVGLAAILTLILAGVLILTLAPNDPLTGTVDQIIAKTRLVGFNQRMSEAAEAIGQVGRSLPSILCGDGWGALIANPAVGGWRVGYTHSFAAYVLLKGGVIGMMAMLVYLLSLTPSAIAVARRTPVLALALLPPLTDGLLMHTSFKFLCFGLLLAVITMAGTDRSPDAQL
ncbi:O-antigen ligase domain-containing protein [uncultured Gammaproteobacteria bacterium]